MIIDCISDLHGHYPELEGGDLLIVAGDLTARDTTDEYWDYFDWAVSQKYKKIIYIAGNHDNILQGNPLLSMHSSEGMLTYLQDSGTEVLYHRYLDPINLDKIGVPYKRKTLKIYGSPWTKRFEGMNPKCMAFTVDTDEELAEKWKRIPSDVDILITHSPPFTVRDMTSDGLQVGSISLMTEFIGNRIQPKLWVFGHIHEAYGQDKMNWADTLLVNASHVNERYEPVNKPIRIEL